MHIPESERTTRAQALGFFGKYLYDRAVLFIPVRNAERGIADRRMHTA